jgi:hypothetical protein
MKFEKFLKRTGTYGQVLKFDNGDKWLICDGVGMKIPFGVNNLLGSGDVPEKVADLVDLLLDADTEYKVMLNRAQITPDGKASDIIRVFENPNKPSYVVGITNADFGLLEKADFNLSFVEIDSEDSEYFAGNKFLLIMDHAGDEVVGFIQGVPTV